MCTIALLAGLAGCADGAESPPGPAEPLAAPSATAAPAGGRDTALTISVDEGRGAVTRWTLTCEPAGGDHPDPRAACRALSRHGARALPPVPEGRLCTQVFAGPEVATVTGTWRGEGVTSRFDRRNGCEVARWDSLTGLLPAAAG